MDINVTAETIGRIEPTFEYLLDHRQFKAAEELATSLRQMWPQNTREINSFLGTMFHFAQAYDKAAKCFRSMPGAPTLSGVVSLAISLNLSGRADEAEELLLSALKSKNHSELWIQLAIAYDRLGKMQKSREALLKSFTAPGASDGSIKYSFEAFEHLRAGDLKKGFQSYVTARNKEPMLSSRLMEFFSAKHKDLELKAGESIAGKTIFIFSDQGWGDQFIGLRYLRMLKDRGAKVFLACSRALHPMIQRLFPVDELIDINSGSAPRFDRWACMMHMAYYLELEFKDVNPGPYISPSDSVKELIPAKLFETSKLKVGLRWQGNSDYAVDAYRRVPFAEMRTLLGLESCQFYSLQRDAGMDEMDPSDNIIDLSHEMQDWDKTCALIDKLDVVVSSCTSVAHLAAAMGKRVYVLAHPNLFYTWAHPGDKSPWYPDVTVLRRSQFGTWKPEIERVKNLLK